MTKYTSENVIYPPKQIYVPLHKETLTTAGIFDATGISQDYDHLMMRLLLRSTQVADSDVVKMFFNGDTTVTNYREQFVYGNGTTHAATNQDNTNLGYAVGASGAAGKYSHHFVEIFKYTETSYKIAFSKSSIFPGTDWIDNRATVWQASTAAINQITIQPDGYATDTFAAGSYLEIIGVKNL